VRRPIQTEDLISIGKDVHLTNGNLVASMTSSEGYVLYLIKSATVVGQLRFAVSAGASIEKDTQKSFEHNHAAHARCVCAFD
jgi:hypothetical protein